MRKSRTNKYSGAAKDRKRSRPWSEDEDARLRVGVERYGCRNWTKISLLVGRRSSDQCCQRWYRSLRPEIRKGQWSEDEDEQLVTLVQEHGTAAWKKVAEFIDGRTDIQCRSRWLKISRRRKNFLKSTKPADPHAQERLSMHSTNFSISFPDSIATSPATPASPTSPELMISTPPSSTASTSTYSVVDTAPPAIENGDPAKGLETHNKARRNSTRAVHPSKIEKKPIKTRSAAKRNPHKTGRSSVQRRASMGRDTLSPDPDQHQANHTTDDTQENFASILVDMSSGYYPHNETTSNTDALAQEIDTNTNRSCGGLLSLYSVATASDVDFSSFSIHHWSDEPSACVDTYASNSDATAFPLQVDRRMMLAHILNTDVHDSS